MLKFHVETIDLEYLTDGILDEDLFSQVFYNHSKLGINKKKLLFFKENAIETIISKKIIVIKKIEEMFYLERKFSI